MKITNYQLLITSLLCFVLLSFPTQVNAHVLQTNGSIGAVIHVTPDDDPIVGSPSDFYFEFKDKTNKFRPENCNCTVSIVKKGEEIFSQPLFQNNTDPSLTNASVTFTFPERNVYMIKVVGTPITPDAFEPFTLTYDLRVERTANTVSPNTSNALSKYIPYLLIVGVSVIVLATVVVKRKNP